MHHPRCIIYTWVYNFQKDHYLHFSSSLSQNSSSEKPQYFPLLLSCLSPLPMGCDSLHLTHSSRYHHPISWLPIWEPRLATRVNLQSPLYGLQPFTRIHGIHPPKSNFNQSLTWLVMRFIYFSTRIHEILLQQRYMNHIPNQSCG